jgi:acid phosphatase
MHHVSQISKTIPFSKAISQQRNSHNGKESIKGVMKRAFFTPNMQNDGHDTTVDYAGNYSRSFLTRLLNNTTFINKTLVLLTFDETETYTIKNKVFAILLGDIIPSNLKGTTDDTFYTHYSTLSTIQNNWNLYHLGRNDINANVFQFVANITKHQNINVVPNDIPYFNFTSIGYFDSLNPGPILAVNTTVMGAGGRGVLPSLKGVNGSAIMPSVSSSSGSVSVSGSSGSASSSSGANISTGGMAACFLGVVGFVVGLLV